jgi:hypothetical protein
MKSRVKTLISMVALAASAAGQAALPSGAAPAATPTPAATPAPAAAPGPGPAPEPGIWQKHEYRFQFLGFTTTYSCDGLADKLKVLLIAAGARSDAKARPGACASGFGRPDKFAQADLTFYTLAPADPASTDPKVPATWRSVAFSDRSPRELALGDCELVEQFKDRVLPMFSTRNIDYGTTCVPHQLSGSAIRLNFDALAPVPTRG